jgi:hypothetical protein
MSYKDWSSPNWRDELSHTTHYKKMFAVRSVICSDGTKVWLKNYYKKFRVWGQSPNWGHSPTGPFSKRDYNHIDFVENITEAEYIVRKLAENL